MKKDNAMLKSIFNIAILLAAMCVFALASCAPISTGGGYSSDGGGAVGSGGDSSGSGGSGGRNGVPITISLPAIGSASIRALTEEQRTRLQRETAKYRVIFSGAGQTITREGTGTMYSATFPVGSQVGVTVYCLNASGEVIVESVTKTITVSTGANSMSFKLSEDGREIVPTPGPQPDPGPTPGPTPDPEPEPPKEEEPPREEPRPQVNVTFHPGWAFDPASTTWEAMTDATLPRNGNRDDDSPTFSEKGSKTGYVFKGWVEDANIPTGDINDIDFQDRFYATGGSVNPSVDLYGIWEKLESQNHFQVILNVGSTPGSAVSSMPNDRQGQANDTVFVDEPSCPGYVFTGWSASPNVTWTNAPYNFTMPSQNVTLTAQWKPVTYKIVYYEDATKQNSQNGATFTVAGGATVQIENTDIFTIPKGYLVVGWENLNGESFGGMQSTKLELIGDGLTAEDPDHPDDNEYLIIPLTLNKQAMTYTINVANNGASEITSHPFEGNRYNVDGSNQFSTVINLTDLSSNEYVYNGKLFKHWSFTANGPQITSTNPQYGTSMISIEEVLNNSSAQIDNFGSITLYPVWADAVTFTLYTSYYHDRTYPGGVDTQSANDDKEDKTVPVGYDFTTDNGDGIWKNLKQGANMTGLVSKDDIDQYKNQEGYTVVETATADMAGKTYYRTSY